MNEEAVKLIASNDCEALLEKDRSYGSSWCRRGGVGAFMNLARKWDRIEEAARQCGWDLFEAYDRDRRPEGILDDIRDLRRYALLFEDYIRNEEWKRTSVVSEEHQEK